MSLREHPATRQAMPACKKYPRTFEQMAALSLGGIWTHSSAILTKDNIRRCFRAAYVGSSRYWREYTVLGPSTPTSRSFTGSRNSCCAWFWRPPGAPRRYQTRHSTRAAEAASPGFEAAVPLSRLDLRDARSYPRSRNRTAAVASAARHRRAGPNSTSNQVCMS